MTSDPGRHARHAAAAAVALATLAAASCGGPPPSMVELRSQATRICAEASRQVGEIATPASEAGGKAFLARGIAALAPERRQLASLTVPGNATVVYRTALGALSGELAALRSATHALARQDDPVIVFKTLQQRLAPLETQADSAWDALQIPTCKSR